MILSKKCTACLLLLCPILSPQALADEPVIPHDLKIVAEYGAGGSVYVPDTFNPWKVTINSDGGVTQVIYPRTVAGNEVKKSASLSRADLNDLLAAIKDADFLTLRGRYQQSFHEGPGLRLQVTTNGKTHEVIAYAPGFKGNAPEVKRFLKVWSEVIKKVPPPKPDQRGGGA